MGLGAAVWPVPKRRSILLRTAYFFRLCSHWFRRLRCCGITVAYSISRAQCTFQASAPAEVLIRCMRDEDQPCFVVNGVIFISAEPSACAPAAVSLGVTDSVGCAGSFRAGG